MSKPWQFWWPQWSLAPTRYSKVHAKHSGPIGSLSYRQSQKYGHLYFETFASLNIDTYSRIRQKNILYGHHDGTGTSRLKSESVYKAISEALERWAWMHVVAKTPTLYGLEVDGSTTGFAAYPGLGHCSATKQAFLEAAERWSLAAWWQGLLGHKQYAVGPAPGVAAIELEVPFRGIYVILVFSSVGSLTAYGFAASSEKYKAEEKALIELDRNVQVLKFYNENRIKFSSQVSSLTEKRLIYFAGREGHQKFKNRLADTHAFTARPIEPKLIVNSPVRGPWDRYANVWRCLFDTSFSEDHGQDDYFLF